MAFMYISGSGTGKNSWFIWARVKAEAKEIFNKMKGNEFKDCYTMRHTNEMRNVSTCMKVFSAFSWLANATNAGNQMEDIGRCMISLCLEGYEKQILKCKDINIYAKRLNK